MCRDRTVPHIGRCCGQGHPGSEDAMIDSEAPKCGQLCSQHSPGTTVKDAARPSLLTPASRLQWLRSPLADGHEVE